LAGKFENDWERLQPETRDYLVEGAARLDTTLSNRPPGTVPSAFFLAVKTELFARLFSDGGKLNYDVMKRVGASNPVMLLIMLGQRNRVPINERKAISERLGQITGGRRFLTDDTVGKLYCLINHRNHAQHPEDKQPYTKSDLEKYLAAVWSNDWLVKFLRLLHSRL
jgi:hypothetical protein